MFLPRCSSLLSLCYTGLPVCLPAAGLQSCTPVAGLFSCTQAVWSTSRSTLSICPTSWSPSRATPPVFPASCSPFRVTPKPKPQPQFPSFQPKLPQHLLQKGSSHPSTTITTADCREKCHNVTNGAGISLCEEKSYFSHGARCVHHGAKFRSSRDWRLQQGLKKGREVGRDGRGERAREGEKETESEGGVSHLRVDPAAF
ncbi:uncharacterized protein LOC122980418 isoform X2 [Thunnus albacares]|uniref:uncharacterized protein LOC122980418 isoform X2 n=1 Tax=Thunnus albacares TaxID=8236 RepID=UPI001CF68223|nr:uncharacterized protein LOC122980418 isoform X2 [Thunnus albacares]